MGGFCISLSVAFYRSAYIWISRGSCVFLWFELEPKWKPQITEYAAGLRFQFNMQVAAVAAKTQGKGQNDYRVHRVRLDYLAAGRQVFKLRRLITVPMRASPNFPSLIMKW